MLRAMIYSDDKIHKISMQSFYAEDLCNLDNRIPRKLIYRITDKIFKNQCVDDWKNPLVDYLTVIVNLPEPFNLIYCPRFYFQSFPF